MGHDERVVLFTRATQLSKRLDLALAGVALAEPCAGRSRFAALDGDVPQTPSFDDEPANCLC